MPTKKPKKKIIELRVTVSAPHWLSRTQAAREVRALINDQAFFGHVNRNPRADQHSAWEEIDDHNFRARKVK